MHSESTLDRETYYMTVLLYRYRMYGNEIKEVYTAVQSAKKKLTFWCAERNSHNCFSCPWLISNEPMLCISADKHCIGSLTDFETHFRNVDFYQGSHFGTSKEVLLYLLDCKTTFVYIPAKYK